MTENNQALLAEIKALKEKLAAAEQEKAAKYAIKRELWGDGGNQQLQVIGPHKPIRAFVSLYHVATLVRLAPALKAICESEGVDCTPLVDAPPVRHVLIETKIGDDGNKVYTRTDLTAKEFDTLASAKQKKTA